MRSPNAWLTVLLLLVAAAGIVTALDADPSPLMWRDFITDEGWWTAEARDRALFNTWVLDEYNQGLTVPLASYAWYAVFRRCGVSLLTARALPAAAALATVLLLAFMTWRRNRQTSDDADRLPPALPALLLAAAVPFALFARVAMPEALSALCLVGAWALLGANRPAADPTDPLPSYSALRALLAGALFGAAVSAKMATIVAAPFLLALACRGRERLGLRFATARWRPAIHVGFAGVLAWAALRLPFGLRFPAEMRVLDVMHRGENIPSTLVDLLANVAFFPWPSPFLYQVAPLLALAGLGAWQIGLRRHGRGVASQALTFLLLTGLTQSVFGNPADRRFVIFLPALALLAARGWLALVRNEEMTAFRLPMALNPLTGWLQRMGVALCAAFILPGRLAIWTGRVLEAAGRPITDFQVRALAGLLFTATMIVTLLLLGRRRDRIVRVMRASLVVNWLFVTIEPFDFLTWAWVGDLLGRYDGGNLWAAIGGGWSIPWGALTLLLMWLILARAGVLRRIPALERMRKPLVYLVPALALAVLAPTWLTPHFTLRDAAATLTTGMEDNTAPVVVGAEAPTLILGSALQAVPVRGEYNRAWRDCPPPRTRMVRLMEDSGMIRETDWPAGADTLDVCGWKKSEPRFRFAVWNTE